ncbi:RHS repeat domain-containing protein [Kribbella sp. NPDC055071]
MTVSTFAISAQTQWSTRTLYGGDTVTTLPPNGAPATAEVKDARGQVIERREYDGGTVTPGYIASNYSYDAGGRLMQMTTAGSTWSYGYDLLGRKISSMDPDSGTTSYEYDDADRIVSVTNANQKKLINTYDNLDRKTAVHEGSQTDANLRLTWDYDVTDKGQLYQSSRYPAGKSGPAYKSKIWSRNELYLPEKTSVVIPAQEDELAGTYASVISYAPDAETVDSTYVPGGGTLGTETLKYTYNQLGQPTQMQSGDAIYANDVKYTPLGDPERYELGNNHDMDIINTFEPGTRRLKDTLAGDVTIVANHHYTYDAAGNLLQDNNLAGSNDSQCYDYDAHRRLTAAWTPESANCATAPSIAGLGGAAPYWQSWTYTADGQRKTQTDHTSTGNTVGTYTYDTSQPHTVKSVATTGAAPKPTATYAYDDAGNTTSRPDPTGTGQTLAWDAENKLQKLTNSAGDTSYVYDADGNLLLRKSPGKSTLYVGSLEVTLDTTTKALTSKREYSIGGQAIAVRSSTTDLKWLVPDHHGTTSVAVDSKTLAVTTRYTTPFGESRGADPSGWPDDHGFLGKPQDKSTGLTHVGAREYDPTTGRFLSVDPLMDTSDPQQMLGYTYGNNNPSTMSDPSGLQVNSDDGSHGDAPDTRVPTTPTGPGANTDGTNQSTTGGDQTGDSGAGGNDNDNSSGGGDGSWFKKTVHSTVHIVDLGNKAWSDYTAGIGAQALDTAKGLAIGAFQQAKCMAISDCSAQIDMVTTIIRNPGSLWNAMVEPVKQDWTNGHQAKASGRVTFMIAETLVGTKGAGRLASTASAATRAGEGAAAKAAASSAAAKASQAPVKMLERTAPSPVKPASALARWDEFLGPGEHTNLHPRTGQMDPDRIVSSDGTRSIRFGDHEMGSAPTKFHYHEETWQYDPIGNMWNVDNVLVRVPFPKGSW